MAEGSARLAIFAARRISCGNHRDHHPDDLVHHLECASGRTGEPESDHEPCQGAVVFSRLAGNVGVFRSLDCRGGDAYAHHLWLDGDSLYRYEPAGSGLLHVETAQVCDRHISFWVHCAVGLDDYHRNFYTRTWVAVV